MSEKRVFIEVSGLNFEAAVHVPDGKMHGGAVICHPHPQYGGDMYNNVVAGVQEALENAGLATLRFNFRGVGGSGGELAGPEGDTKDLLQITGRFAGLDGIDSERIALVGYSYGAMIAISACKARSKISPIVAISPHVEIQPIEFLPQIANPLLMITGDRDVLCPQNKIRGMLPEGANLEVVRGADHFYWGHEEEVGEKAASFLKKELERP